MRKKEKKNKIIRERKIEREKVRKWNNKKERAGIREIEKKRIERKREIEKIIKKIKKEGGKAKEREGKREREIVEKREIERKYKMRGGKWYFYTCIDLSSIIDFFKSSEFKFI